MSQRIDAVVIGASAGGVDALNILFTSLTVPLNVPIVVVLHIAAHASIIADAFRRGPIPVKEAEDKELLQPGVIYFAAPGYHLLVENDLTVSLSVEEPVQFSRPSIDVLFESAAIALQERLLGILLTGANEDGAKGLQCIQSRGGMTVVQNPEEASYRTMPEAALKRIEPTRIARIAEIGNMLNQLQTQRTTAIEAFDE